MLTGKIQERDGKLYVVYETTLENEPILKRLWWLVERTTGNPWNASRPTLGNTARPCGHGIWHTWNPENISTGYVYVDGTKEAVFVEMLPVPCPKIRSGILTRWNSGAWEKCTKTKGWIRF